MDEVLERKLGPALHAFSALPQLLFLWGFWVTKSHDRLMFVGLVLGLHGALNVTKALSSR